ncbi:hypothetical protein CPB84DRAFT_1786890 [Gymnopilus junonius]|uniref:DUF6533 domain-containing protein n=1 Tax=Gymnopilus junonius TaxID=109634 RepID=A0A9P5TK56_GYMJU|nr:hypothetical protein CPB84DRAFT_1786890 [Gymnopilus junonius]
MTQLIPSVNSDIFDTVNTNYVGFASFAVLVWDHIDTFADEVELIWKGKRKGLFIYLFLFNRYFTPLGFIINLYAYLSPSWTIERCARFVRYEGCTVAMAVEGVGLMMLLRIRAIYPHQRWITAGLGGLLVIETIMNAWLISRGQPVIHNPNSGVHACSMIFDPSISSAASASAWIPLLYDTIIFGLTLYRTLPPILREEASYIIKRLLEDGMLYYSVIFSVTFVLTFMIVGAPPGTKNICAQMEQLITVAMMSRITLNLKRAGEQLNSDTLSSPKSLLFDRMRRRSRQLSERRPSFIMTFPLPAFPATIINSVSGSTEIVFAHPSPLPTPITPDERIGPIGISDGAPEQNTPITVPPRSAYVV